MDVLPELKTILAIYAVFLIGIPITELLATGVFSYYVLILPLSSLALTVAIYLGVLYAKSNRAATA